MTQTQSQPLQDLTSNVANIGDFANSICQALLQTTNNDNNARLQAENYMKEVQGHELAVSNLLMIATNQEVNKSFQGEVSQQAALFLKLLVNQNWTSSSAITTTDGQQSLGKENMGGQNSQSNGIPNGGLAPKDKAYLQAEIFGALDNVVHLTDARSKVIVSSIENMIYNMAQMDFAQWWPTASQQIHQRLTAQGDERFAISGLRALKSIIQAFEFEINAERKPLNQIVEVFFPVLEGILGQTELQSSPNYIPMMILVCKIFFMANQLEVSPYLLQPGKVAPWVSLFKQILETSLGAEYETPTESHQQISQLNKSPCWQLKGIVAQITLKLFQKSGTSRSMRTGRQTLDHFFHEFDTTHSAPLCQAHLKVLQDKKTQFVGTKTLNSALRFVSVAIKTGKMRKLCAPHIQTILFELTLPLMLISEYEYEIWTENSIEYVRLQVDNSNSWNVKRTNQDLIQAICNIRQTRKNKISNYLTQYLSMLVENMQQNHEDFRFKEALLHSYGLLASHMAHSKEYQKNAELMLQQYVFQELSSDVPFLRARACWVYGQFGNFPFENNDHLTHALNGLYQNLSHNDLPVRVNAAIALIKMLEHEIAVEFLRPGLETVIKIYLKLIDDIDYDGLIECLKTIVDVFEEEIGPYAVQLCSKLGEAFLRLFNQSRATNGNGNELDEDVETSLTAGGLMTAIRRILQSISGKYPALYPQLEEILEQPILATLNDSNAAQTDEGLTCIAELLYNQQTVSPRMWNFYQLMVTSLMQDKGILDEYLDEVFVTLINFMNKDPNQFKSASFADQQGTCLDMCCALVGKTFELARVKEDEIEAICAITLVNAMLENIQGIDHILPGIIDLYLGEMKEAQTPDYKIMLLQGVLMCLWYNAGVTLSQLESRQATASIFTAIFESVNQVSQDFEVKKFMLGLSALLSPAQMPEVVSSSFANIFKALVFLSSKAIEIRAANLKKHEKEEMAEVEEEGEGAIIEDEEDFGVDIDSDEDDDDLWEDSEAVGGNDQLYDSPLDNIDEILNLHQQLANLQGNGASELHQFLMSQLDQNEAAQLEYTLNVAQQQKMQEQQEQEAAKAQ